jgi:hypothetical protein
LNGEVKIFSWGPFTSASRCIEVAKKFVIKPPKGEYVRVLFIIQINGKSVQVLNIEPYSVFPGEKEIVVHPMSVFTIEDTHYDYSEKLYYVKLSHIKGA